MPKEREHLKKLRIQCGYTQQEVADKLGVSKATISKYEKGQRKLNHTEELATLYGVDEAYIFLGKSLDELKKAVDSRYEKSQDQQERDTSNEEENTEHNSIIDRYTRFIAEHPYLIKMLNEIGVELQIIDLFRISIRYGYQEEDERVSVLLSDLETLHSQNTYRLKTLLRENYGFDMTLDEED